MASIRSLFGFPNPVDEVAARVVAGGVVTMASAAVALDLPLLLLPLTYGFAARVTTGPKLSPLGMFATRVVAPRVAEPHPLSPGAPKRLAQGLGLALSGTAAVLRLGFGRRRAANVVLGALITAAGLEAAFGYCVACRLFPLLMRTGLVSEKVCQDCADIWQRSKS